MSVSLARSDVEYLDEYARRRGVGSRSAAVQRAVRLMRGLDLESAYTEAWTEWASGEDAVAWDATAGDGLEAP